MLFVSLIFLQLIFQVDEMKLFGILVVVCLVSELNAIPSPLQGFGGGDQTTGSKWPPFENAGQDYWALKAQNVDVGGQNFDDGKNIIKKGVQQVQVKVPEVPLPLQPVPVQTQKPESPQSGPTPGLPVAQPTAIAHAVAPVTPVAIQASPVPAAPVPAAPVIAQAKALPTPPVYQNYPFLAQNRGLYAYYNGRQYLLRNY